MYIIHPKKYTFLTSVKGAATAIIIEISLSRRTISKDAASAIRGRAQGEFQRVRQRNHSTADLSLSQGHHPAALSKASSLSQTSSLSLSQTSSQSLAKTESNGGSFEMQTSNFLSEITPLSDS
jgi:hypothetical protein